SSADSHSVSTAPRSYTLSPYTTRFRSRQRRDPASGGRRHGFSDSFDVVSADGTHHTVNITINGTNDPATFTGDDTGDVTEDTQTSAQRALTVSDIDDNQSSAQAASGST